MKTNLIYCVAKKDIFRDLEPIIESLIINKQDKMDRVIIFCRKYDEVTALYHYFQRKLRDSFTYPEGAPNLAQYRTIDMYTHCTHDSVKEEVIKLFTRDSQLRMVMGTIAFGMGIDCPDVREVIHWGVSDDCEMYVQESGRSGRDGGLSRCFIFYGGRDLDKRRVSEGMINYCKNESFVCRRRILFSDFEECSASSNIGCLCCDICRVNCNCGSCDKTLGNFIDFNALL